MIFVSTGGIRGKQINEHEEVFKAQGILNLEFSGGVYENEVLQKLINLEEKGFSVQIHNYFPVPERSFVLNIASQREEIRSASIKHCMAAIDIASGLRLKRYSIHAGFYQDPEPAELGKPWSARNLGREIAHLNFIESLKDLKRYASQKGVDLYIENNVVIKNNIVNGQSLLMTTTMDEMVELRERCGVKLLVDTGHLIVSARSHDLEEKSELEKCFSEADAYHVSTNNRLRDENKPISPTNEILKGLRSGADFYTLEIYDEISNIIDSINVLKEHLS